MDPITTLVLPVGLGLVMFSMGLNLTVADFLRVFMHARAIVCGLVSLLVLVPLLGLLVARLAPVDASLALGIFLIATCPGGTFSNLLTSYGKGDLALSISMTAIGSLLYVFVAPEWLTVGLTTFMHEKATVHIQHGQTMIDLARIIVLPTVLGMTTRRLVPERVRLPLESWVKNLAAVLVVSIFIYILYRTHRSLDSAVFLPVVLLNVLTVLLGWIAARVAGVAPRQTLSIVCEHAVRQEGTAIYLVTAVVLIPAAAIPLMLNPFVGFTLGCLFIALSRMREARRARASGDGTSATVRGSSA